MKYIDTDTFGVPDISLSGLKIWIFGRQFEHSTDFWDANWLMITAQCSSKCSKVVTQGPIIHLSEIEQWMLELQRLNETLHGEARLNCMELELDASVILARTTGSGSLSVRITPDPQNEQHEFTFPIDQSYLLPLIGDLQTVLRKYPIKGTVA